MSMKYRIEQLEKQAQAIDLRYKVKFFDSHDEYMKALQHNKIKEHHICLIDDVEH